jgi:cupin 2 domain-containing protein
MRAANLFADLPAPAAEEHFETLFARPGLRIERILSHRHASPPGFWYEQPDDEWVLLARAAPSSSSTTAAARPGPGDWLLIPAGCRHRVAATGPDTVWLAVRRLKPSQTRPAYPCGSPQPEPNP